jgi:hypothetical protein
VPSLKTIVWISWRKYLRRRQQQTDTLALTIWVAIHSLSNFFYVRECYYLSWIQAYLIPVECSPTLMITLKHRNLISPEIWISYI